MKKQQIYVVLFVASIVAMLVGVSLAEKRDDLKNWVMRHLSEGERILCQSQIENNFFFLSRSDNKVKTGYRLDVTGRDDVPKPYIISWKFRNEKGEYVETNIQPEIVTEGYLKLGDSMYAEEIAYRHLYLNDSVTLHATVELKKYETQLSGNFNEEFIEKDELEKIIECKVNLRE